MDRTVAAPGKSRLLPTLRIQLLAWLGALVLRLIHRTYRWKIESSVPLPEIDKEPWVFAFWHDSLLMLPGLRWQVRPTSGAVRPVTMLTSRHGDGQIIANAIRHLGLRAVSGSSSRGGAVGLRALRRSWNEGSHVGITPDGPRGPRHVCKPGIVALAAQTSGHVYPIAVAASAAWHFKSWDRMCLPKPFSTIGAVLGPPIPVETGGEAGDLERASRALQTSLEHAGAAAEKLCRG